ncbi:MAG TPA: hypothetical protein VKF38_15960 [Anaerolineaceae bacterium]|nr:hypothetical protein [Anaerolineaceae bacterium]
MKFSMWPFHRKKDPLENPKHAVQPQAKTETTEVETGTVPDGELARIAAPGVLPILGNEGGWDKMRITLPGREPGIAQLEENLNLTDSEGIFKTMIEPDKFARNLASLTSFNISEILSGEKGVPGFREELPVIKDGMTDLFAQLGNLPEQIAGMSGKVPTPSVPQHEINRKIVGQLDATPDQLSKADHLRMPASALDDIGAVSPDQGQPILEPIRDPASLSSINTVLSNLDMSIVSNKEGIELNPPGSSIAIIKNSESFLPAPDQIPMSVLPDTSEITLINLQKTGTQPESSGEKDNSIPKKIAYKQFESEIDLLSRAIVSKPGQPSEEGYETHSTNTSTPIEIQREVGKPVISRMMKPVSEQFAENETFPLVYLEGEKRKGQSLISKKTDRGEESPAQNGLFSPITGGKPGRISDIEENKSIQINHQPIQLVSLAKKIVMRQSQPLEEMIMTLPFGERESESDQITTMSAPALFNLLGSHESNPINVNTIENGQLDQDMITNLENADDEKNPIKTAPELEVFGKFSKAGLVQNNNFSGVINRIGPSVSRFAMPGQFPEMSMIENNVRNAAAGVNQEMQTVQSAEMPIINQGMRPADGTPLGGGLPQMTLPPTIGETLAALNPASGGNGQSITELAERATSKVEQSEVPQMPNIDRLTDQIWQQIQRRLQIERERSRGMA